MARYVMKIGDRGALDNIDGLQSAASDIDNTVVTGNAVINVLNYGAQGDGLTDDTGAIQSLIDEQHAIWLAGERYDKTTRILIPVGKFAVINLIVKGGVEIFCLGELVPAQSTGTVVKIAGSHITIPKLTINAVHHTFTGKLMTLDQTDPQTAAALSGQVWDGAISYNDFSNIKLLDYGYNSEVALHLKSAGSVTWNRFNDIDLRGAKSGLVIELSGNNGPYANSNLFNGKMNECVNQIVLDSSGGDGEISSNEFNFHMQPNSSAGAIALGVQGIYCYGNVTSNTFKGVLWDWKDTYKFAIYDDGKFNTYGDNVVSDYKSTDVMIVDATTKHPSRWHNVPAHSNLYNYTQHNRNGIGFQDNLLAYAVERGASTFTPAGNHDYRCFQEPASKDWHTQITWPEADGGGSITVEILTPGARINTVAVGLDYLGRTCSNILCEISTDGITYDKSYDEIYENVSEVALFANSGYDGYNCEKIRVTFTNGINALDRDNILPPSSNQLSIRSIVAFGEGSHHSFDGGGRAMDANGSYGVMGQVQTAQGDGTWLWQ